MQKPTTTHNDSSYPVKVDDREFAERFPVLLMYLSDTKWDDGSAREPSTITLFIESGTFKAALNDRDGKRSMYVSAGSLRAVLDALEANVSEDRGDWRSWNARTKKK